VLPENFRSSAKKDFFNNLPATNIDDANQIDKTRCVGAPSELNMSSTSSLSTSFRACSTSSMD
jgi:hypothetical protein